MAAPSKQSSRWGGFLSQAVAGLESRLDSVLADEMEEAPKKSTTSLAPAKPDANVSRSPSNSSNRANDRLQERLARAVAAKNAAAQKSSATSASNAPSRTASPATINESPRQSLDVPSPSTDGKTGEEPSPTSDVAITTSLNVGTTPTIEIQADTQTDEEPAEKQGSNDFVGKAEEAAPRMSLESVRSGAPRESIDSSRPQQNSTRPSIEISPSETSDPGLPSKLSVEYDAQLKQLQSDYETSELQRQEEVHGYIERIDALQSKLQYLAKESVDAARKSRSSAPGGSLEKKLADREEQVALLMQEGQQLSKKEMAHLTTIKKLRAKIQEDTKEVTEANAKREKAEREAAMALERVRRAEGTDKRLGEKQKQVFQLQKDIEALKSEKDSKNSIIADLRKQLDDAAAHEKQAEAKAASEALQQEKKRSADLEEDLANLKIEKNLVSDRAQAQIKELREKMGKDAERVRITELEMKTEQQMLESKLEVMRARAEEVSSGATGDAQAKLLRQIETIQSQYAVASENWQGIEASLVARATNLEKERDEASRREADIRKKAREVTLKAKRHEDELEKSRSRLPGFQQEITEHKKQLENLQKRSELAEAALLEAKTTFTHEKQAWKVELQQRLDEEKQRWQEEMGQGSANPSRAESPNMMRRGLTSEFLGLQNLQIRRSSARSTTASEVPTADRFLSRRPSAQVLARSGNGTPTRQDSMQSFVLTNGEVNETPSIITDHDDFFENVASPSSPHQTLNDMVSVSTAGAGPSVQLVERMSSAVRRLESEKAATKEDLGRLAAQRDEARAEIVSLMKEVGVKRAADRKVVELEKEVGDLKARYETTLEMLGEKSEMVEELRSDIDDIKAMYRELVERTVK